MTEPSCDASKIESMEHVHCSTLNGLIRNFPQKVQKFIESCISKTSQKEDSGTISAFSPGSNKYSSTVLDIDLAKQLHAWKENPVWVDTPPNIQVSVPKGSLCNLNVKVDVGLPPDAVYNIVIDPDNRRVFKNIKEVLSRRVLVDEGQRQVIEVEQAALWRFLWWSGTISVHVWVDQNREDHSLKWTIGKATTLPRDIILSYGHAHTSLWPRARFCHAVPPGVSCFIYRSGGGDKMKFKQVKAGFMKRFEGSWKVDPIFVDEQLCDPFKPKTLKDYMTCTRGKGRIASKVSLDQLIQPSIVPPPPISWYLRGITTRTTEMIITDLLTEAARIRGSSKNADLEETIAGGEAVHRIKERWALRRRDAKNSRRKLMSRS